MSGMIRKSLRRFWDLNKILKEGCGINTVPWRIQHQDLYGWNGEFILFHWSQNKLSGAGGLGSPGLYPTELWYSLDPEEASAI